MTRTERGRKTRLLAGVAVSAALLVPLAVFGAPAIAGSLASASSQYQYSGSAQYQYRVTICHRTHSKHTITISSRALKAHLRHGDTVGACSAASAPTSKHGPDHGNGKSHHNK
jgi:hypothetical protein